MSCCASTAGFDRQFGAAKAKADLEAYRRDGPNPATRRLVAAIRELRGDARTLLDVGSGIGIVAHELMPGEIDAAVLVDVSPDYVAAASDEAARRNTSARVHVRQGDFVDLAADIAPADIVTLDRVICCYPDMDRLIRTSASRARRLYGVTYPRDNWWVRVKAVLDNTKRRLRGRSFRTYIFPVHAIHAAIERQGFVRRRFRRGFVWDMALYERSAPFVS